jgi:acetyl esterase/lipase
MLRYLSLLAACGLYAQAPAPQIPDSVAIERNIAYDKHPETVVDILQPKAPGKEKRPGVVVIHGGGWTGGT